MIEIELKNGQTGYSAIEEYIHRYWKHHMTDDVIVSLGTSYDGKVYEYRNEIASPLGFNDIEFLYDWWEGEKFIRLFGIISLDEISVRGGIYIKD